MTDPIDPTKKPAEGTTSAGSDPQKEINMPDQDSAQDRQSFIDPGEARELNEWLDIQADSPAAVAAEMRRRRATGELELKVRRSIAPDPVYDTVQTKTLPDGRQVRDAWTIVIDDLGNIAKLVLHRGARESDLLEAEGLIEKYERGELPDDAIDRWSPWLGILRYYPSDPLVAGGEIVACRWGADCEQGVHVEGWNGHHWHANPVSGDGWTVQLHCYGDGQPWQVFLDGGRAVPAGEVARLIAALAWATTEAARLNEVAA